MDNSFVSLGTILALTVGGAYTLAAALFLVASRIPPATKANDKATGKATEAPGTPPHTERTSLLSAPALAAEEEEAA